jgi:hypothetical protein
MHENADKKKENKQTNKCLIDLLFSRMAFFE